MPVELDGLPPLGEAIAKYGISANRSLGQNFILDLNLTRRIAREAGNLEDVSILEIGAGPGGLTRALLLEGARQVLAVEIDQRFEPVLFELSEIARGRLTVVMDDGLKVQPLDYLDRPVKIVSNLPYGVATRFLASWLECRKWPPFWQEIVVMLQREVAERVTATHGSKTFGRLTILCQFRSEAKIIANVSRQAFTPTPDVDSSIVRIVPRPSPLTPDGTAALHDITRAAFGQRRKMLRRSLRQASRNIQDLLRASAIDPTWRAEDVPVDKFVRLAALVAQGRSNERDFRFTPENWREQS
ncbi:MAG: 16S rRNA (adenine(1518)-N(6)/adenine(1519)-N(6))-dimethyltransferase RsmA [Rhodobacteraceae bacterium]|nr:16S rRNA (adenine(1518)-N(6)/adenine(1519)-N(6))-dimethyltransferase RsmA [Paracoccaceae bacterium]